MVRTYVRIKTTKTFNKSIDLLKDICYNIYRKKGNDKMFIQCIFNKENNSEFVSLPLNDYNWKIVQMHESVLVSIEIWKEIAENILQKVEKIK